jgi:hypothetical protein
MKDFHLIFFQILATKNPLKALDLRQFGWKKTALDKIWPNFYFV